jgi:hypothetical protein
MPPMAPHTLNRQAVARVRPFIDARRYVPAKVRTDVQPSADGENAFPESHFRGKYDQWHLPFTGGARDNTKPRYAYVYGDFRRVRHMGLSLRYRATIWRHKEVELAAHDLLQYLDKSSG